MKKIILLLSATVFLISCSNVGKGEFLITGTAKGIDNGKTIILETQDANGLGLIALDTVKVENGKFEFKGKITEPSFHTLQLESANGKVLLILEDGEEVTIAIDKDSIQKSKVSGTYNNDEYVKFSEELVVMQKKLADFQKKNADIMTTAQQTQDTIVINKLMKEFAKIQEAVSTDSKKKYFGYAETHPKAFISALIVQGMMNDPAVDMKKIESLYKGLDESLKATKPGKAIKTRLEQAKMPAAATPPPSVGASNWDSNFTAPNPEGKLISLKQSLGKITIVDFWASWCKPCRIENPNLVAIYKDFHSKGLNIVGVSLDKDSKKWKEAIANDKLSWIHVSHLKFWDEPIALQYEVQEIPSTFILDSTGKIVAKNLTGDALRLKIIQLLSI